MAMDLESEFEAILYEYIQDVLEDFPIFGSQLGLHEYDFKVPDMSEKAFERRIKYSEKYLERISSISPEDLPPKLRIDYHLVKNWMEETLITIRDWPQWRMYPIGVEVSMYSILALLMRTELPKWHVTEALKARIRAIPNMVDQSIRCVKEPYSIWVRHSRMILSSFPAIVEGCRPFWDEDLKKICMETCDELEDPLEKLERMEENAKKGYKPIGEDLFRKILKLNFISETPEELERIGKKEAERYLRKMAEISSKMGFESLEKAMEKMKENRPKDPQEAMKIFRECVSLARNFTYSKGIVERIPMEKVNVIETPEPMRFLIPFAGYIPPEIFSWSLTGTFLVTLPKTEEGLFHFNYYDVLNTTVHEAYPGHHVQLVYSKLCKDPIRKILGSISGTFSEGWAHYCEELCLEMGICEDPMYHLKVYHDALWRAVRVYLDVELSTGKISFEDAVEELHKRAMLPKEGAYFEVVRYTMNPGYQLSYNYVKRKILALREKVKEILGEKFSLKEFHQWLLEEGGIPISLAFEKVLEKARRKAEGK